VGLRDIQKRWGSFLSLGRPQDKRDLAECVRRILAQRITKIPARSLNQSIDIRLRYYELRSQRNHCCRCQYRPNGSHACVYSV